MLDRLSDTLTRGAPSTRGVRDAVRDIPVVVLDAAASARRALTVRRVAWTAGVVLAFAVPFAAARGDSTVAGTSAIEPPAPAGALAPPRLSAVAPLPEPPRIVRRRPPAVAPAPVAVATPVPVPTPEAAVPAPAPAPAPAPERETFDLEG
jgi:hypothetical protein